MVPVKANGFICLSFCVFMALVAWLFPHRINRPSDFFSFFYLLTCVIWAGVLWGGSGLIEADDVPLYFALLLSPVLAVKLLRAVWMRFAAPYILPVQLASVDALPFVLIAILILGGGIGVITVGDGGFELDGTYIRRLAGRDAFAGSAFSAYVVGMAVNGAMPILGFIAGYRRSLLLFCVSLIFVILMYYLLGLKSPAINLAAMTAIGVALSYSALRRNIVPLSLAIIVLVYIVALCQFLIFDSAFLADYLIRRISMTQPQVQSYYFHYWLHQDAAAAVLDASGRSFSDTTYAIGYIYLNSLVANVDTNAFFYALGSLGLSGYTVAVFAVAALFALIDIMYEKLAVEAFFGVSALFALMLAEQAWTTVMLSSGMALCLMLVMLFSYPPRRRLHGSV